VITYATIPRYLRDPNTDNWNKCYVLRVTSSSSKVKCFFCLSEWLSSSPFAVLFCPFPKVGNFRLHSTLPDHSSLYSSSGSLNTCLYPYRRVVFTHLVSVIPLTFYISPLLPLCWRNQKVWIVFGLVGTLNCHRGGIHPSSFFLSTTSNYYKISL